MKKTIISALAIIAGFVLQCTFCQFIAFGNIKPNLLIILTAAFGFMNGKKSGIISGFFIGLLNDIFFSSVLGFHALLFMYIGYFNGFFRRMYYKEDLKLTLALVGSSDLIYNLIYYLLQFLLRRKFHFIYYFTRIVIPEVVYTIILTIVIFIIFTFLDRVTESFRDNRSNKEIV